MNERWLGFRLSGSLSAVLALSSLASVGCIGIIEPPPPPYKSTSLDETVHLAKEQPVAVRHLAFEVSPPDRGINVTLTINAHRFITENAGEFAEEVTLSVRPDLAPESGAYDIDWLSLCEAGEDCDVEVGIDFEYDRLASQARVTSAVDNRSAPPPPAEFRFVVDALARLEAFDGPELTGGELKLTAE